MTGSSYGERTNITRVVVQMDKHDVITFDGFLIIILSLACMTLQSKNC